MLYLKIMKTIPCYTINLQSIPFYGLSFIVVFNCRPFVCQALVLNFFLSTFQFFDLFYIHHQLCYNFFYVDLLACRHISLSTFSTTTLLQNLRNLLWKTSHISRAFLLHFPGPVNRFYFVLTTKNIFSLCRDVNYCVVWLKISQTSLKSLIGLHLYCS